MRTIRLLAVALAARLGVDFQYRAALPGYRYSFHAIISSIRTFAPVVVLQGTCAAPMESASRFELVFFRQGQRRDEPVENRSAWRIDDATWRTWRSADIDGKQLLSR
jgi:hypothetical protein